MICQKKVNLLKKMRPVRPGAIAIAERLRVVKN